MLESSLFTYCLGVYMLRIRKKNSGVQHTLLSVSPCYAYAYRFMLACLVSFDI